MTEATRALVRHRAGGHCEYCHIPAGIEDVAFSVDHVVARKHGGPEESSNLAFCCMRCNLFKGTDLSGVDPESGKIVPLFNPRAGPWEEHLELVGAEIRGITPTGRATAITLRIELAGKGRAPARIAWPERDVDR